METRFLGTIGKTTFRVRANPVSAESSAPAEMAPLVEKFEAVGNPTSLRITKNIFVVYHGNFDLENGFANINSKMSDYDVGITVGIRTDALLAYIYKVDSKAIPTEWGLHDSYDLLVRPVFYRINGRKNQSDFTGIVRLFSDCLAKLKTTLFITTDTGYINFDSLNASVDKLTPLQLERLRGEALPTPPSMRSSLQMSLLRALPALQRCRELATQNGLAFNAFEPPMAIAPLNQFVNLYYKNGTKLNTSTGNLEDISILDLFLKPILGQHAVLLYGPDSSSGYGKTQLLLRLAVEYARAFSIATGTPKADAMVYFSNTLDALRDFNIKRGSIVILDEFSPSDPDQLVHMSSNMLKSLLNPMATATVRCRMRDLVIPGGVPRLMSANADNMEEWVGRKGKFTEPIQRRLVRFNVEHRLVRPTWAGDTNEADEDVSVADCLAEHAQAHLLPSAVSPSSSLRDTLMRVIRAAFGM